MTIKAHGSGGSLSYCSAEQNELGGVATAVDKMRERPRSCRRYAGFKCRRRRRDEVVAALVIPLTQCDHRDPACCCRHAQYALEGLRYVREKIVEIADDLPGCRKCPGRTRCYGRALERQDFDVNRRWSIRRIGNSNPTYNERQRRCFDIHPEYRSRGNRYSGFRQCKRQQISAEGGGEVLWSKNGELFYRTGANRERMMVVDVETQSTLRAGKPRLLFEGHQFSTTLICGGPDCACSPALSIRNRCPSALTE